MLCQYKALNEDKNLISINVKFKKNNLRKKITLSCFKNHLDNSYSKFHCAFQALLKNIHKNKVDKKKIQGYTTNDSKGCKVE